MPTVRAAIDRALTGFVGLTEKAEPIEEEWQYVADLETVWRARFAEVADARGDEPLTADVEAAIDRVTEEAAAIDDPHRAIDWLSTLPQVVLLALGEAA